MVLTAEGAKRLNVLPWYFQVSALGLNTLKKVTLGRPWGSWTNDTMNLCLCGLKNGHKCSVLIHNILLTVFQSRPYRPIPTQSCHTLIWWVILKFFSYFSRVYRKSLLISLTDTILLLMWVPDLFALCVVIPKKKNL